MGLESGYFLGLKLAFLLIIAGIEAYFLIFDKYIEGEIHIFHLPILIGTFIFSLFLIITKISFFSIFPLPICYLIIRFCEKSYERRIEKKLEDEKLKRLINMVKGDPHNYELNVRIGDIYFEKKYYTEALKYYRNAEKINPTPEINHKIKIAEREEKIEKGEIWICPECSVENMREDEICKNCGYIRDTIKSIKEDVKKHKEWIKKNLFFVIFIPFIITLILSLIKTASQTFFFYLSFFISIFVIYFLLRKFYSW